MRLAEVHLKKFKRFTDLKITRIPEDAKIVVVIGPNGGGKSSIFEAFNLWHNMGINATPDFHVKKEDQLSETKLSNFDFVNGSIIIDFHGESLRRNNSDIRFLKAFYFRTANRYEADFTSQGIGKRGPILSEAKPALLINDDRRVSLNYNRLAAQALEDLFANNDSDVTAIEMRDRLVIKVRESMGRVFEDLLLEGLGNPAIDGTFVFSKGVSKNYKYKNLSAGEKAAFDLLLDIIVRYDIFDDSVFFIDEPELHMHMDLQAKLFAELFRLIPDKAQLWIATHSLGILSEALKKSKDTGQVYFIDLHNQNFDEKTEIHAEKPSKSTISNIYQTTIGNLADLIAPEHVVLCEGSLPSGNGIKNSEFDAKVFNSIFENEFPNTRFISFGSSSDIERDASRLNYLLVGMMRGIRQTNLLDRDDRNQSDIEDLRLKGIKVLSRRDIESYIWDHEIVLKFLESVSRTDAFDEYLSIYERVKSSAIDRGIMPDDVKSFSGEVFVNMRKMLKIPGLGQKKEAFLYEFLVPQITAETAVYKLLKEDIFS